MEYDEDLISIRRYYCSLKEYNEMIKPYIEFIKKNALPSICIISSFVINHYDVIIVNPNLTLSYLKELEILLGDKL